MGSIIYGLPESQEPEENPQRASENLNIDRNANRELKAESQKNLENQKLAENPSTSTEGKLKNADDNIQVTLNSSTDQKELKDLKDDRKLTASGDSTALRTTTSRAAESDDENTFIQTIYSILGFDSSDNKQNRKKTEEIDKTEAKLNISPQTLPDSRSYASDQELNKNTVERKPFRRSSSVGPGIKLSRLNVPGSPTIRTGTWSSSKEGTSGISKSYSTSPSSTRSSTRLVGSLGKRAISCLEFKHMGPILSGSGSHSSATSNPRIPGSRAMEGSKEEIKLTEQNRKTMKQDTSRMIRTMTTGHINQKELGINSEGHISRLQPRSITVSGPSYQRNLSNFDGTIQDNATTGQHLEEGKITAIELPTARKGFIGDIGFKFTGVEPDENECFDDWEAQAQPILVESVTRGSIADKAGLEAGDEIIKINGVSVKNAARPVAVALIRNSQKKIIMLVRKGKGGKRTTTRVFSKDQIDEFCDAFSIYDRSNKGKIHINDVPNACRILGFNETALNFDNAINAARVTTGEQVTSDKVDLKTFIEVIKEFSKFQNTEEDAKFAYAVFDPEERGRFNIRLLRDALRASSTKITTLEMVEMFCLADPDRDERVQEKDFMALLYPYIKMY